MYVYDDPILMEDMLGGLSMYGMVEDSGDDGDAESNAQHTVPADLVADTRRFQQAMHQYALYMYWYFVAKMYARQLYDAVERNGPYQEVEPHYQAVVQLLERCESSRTASSGINDLMKCSEMDNFAKMFKYMNDTYTSQGVYAKLHEFDTKAIIRQFAEDEAFKYNDAADQSQHFHTALTEYLKAPVTPLSIDHLATIKQKMIQLLNHFTAEGCTHNVREQLQVFWA